MKNKKSQMELLGLAIVIVLIAMGILFIIRFSVLKEPSETKKKYTFSELASNTVSAMLIANSGEECKNINIRDLLIDCAEHFSSNGSIICEDGNKSCFYVREATRSIFNKTLDTWNRNYQLNVSTSSNTVLNSSRGSCLGERKSSLFFFETLEGTLFIRLDVCG